MTHPIILCGGSGTRLWPVSRQSFPKQFVKLVGEKSLFQECANLLNGKGFAKPIIVTNERFRFIVVEQLAELNIDPGAIIIEPSSKNTAPAILAAALYIYKSNQMANMIVCPSDHLITDKMAFRKTIEMGLKSSTNGDIVTFGIKPSHPETGYGYLELPDKPNKKPAKVTRFIEKPNLKKANEMVSSQNFLWNSGIYLFNCSSIFEAFNIYAKSWFFLVQNALNDASIDLGFIRLDTNSWAKLPDISIDFAIMEHAKNLIVVPFNQSWSDLGDWSSVWKQGNIDNNGVVKKGNVTDIDCKNSLIRSEDNALEIVGIGLKNIIVVAMQDAVLVADKRQSQLVGEAVSILKEKKVSQAMQSKRDHRPWGWFDSLIITDTFQVKRIVVNPGSSLSMQSHKYRAEHWVVVEGTAKVTIEREQKMIEKMIEKNQSIYIPIGSKHRLENPNQTHMVLIEVQTGQYFGEDDIVRYQDNYLRK